MGLRFSKSDRSIFALGFENILFILGALAVVTISASVVGLIITTPLLVASQRAIESREVDGLVKADRFSITILAAFAIFSMFLSLDKDHGQSWQNLSLIGFIAVFLLHFGWTLPIRRKVVYDEIFYSDNTSANTFTGGRKPSIFGFDKFVPYSTANELAKWSNLRERGIISEAEYNDIRRKLLS